jgi:hypothetical protein
MHLPLISKTQRTLALLVSVACLLTTSRNAAGDDMRVYTTVNILNESGAPKPLSHSLTLFHAGKVYDYMEEVGEVVILEPVRHRFVILGANYTATEVSFTQLLQFLEKTEGVAHKYIEELQASKRENSLRTAAAVRFQLEPRFQVTHADSRLKLTGQLISYDAETTKIESQALTRQFLDYADWTARLNYVLHPHTLLPACRLNLNQQLRDRDELPVTVTLTRNFDGVSRLQARHRFEWALQDADKQSISQWERTLSSDRVKWVSFHEYQEKLLVKVKE